MWLIHESETAAVVAGGSAQHAAGRIEVPPASVRELNQLNIRLLGGLSAHTETGSSEQNVGWPAASSLAVRCGNWNLLKLLAVDPHQSVPGIVQVLCRERPGKPGSSGVRQIVSLPVVSALVGVSGKQKVPCIVCRCLVQVAQGSPAEQQHR